MGDGGFKKVPFQRRDKVLDVGCGNEKITFEIAKQVQGGMVIGLDVSEQMLQFATTHYPLENLLYAQGFAEKIPF